MEYRSQDGGRGRSEGIDQGVCHGQAVPREASETIISHVRESIAGLSKSPGLSLLGNQIPALLAVSIYGGGSLWRRVPTQGKKKL